MYSVLVIGSSHLNSLGRHSCLCWQSCVNPVRSPIRCEPCQHFWRALRGFIREESSTNLDVMLLISLQRIKGLVMEATVLVLQC